MQSDDICTVYEGGPIHNELDIAKMLGIDDLIDSEPITAELFFKKLRPVYERIFTEKPNPNSQKLTPREFFKVSPFELIVNDNKYPLSKNNTKRIYNF